VQVEIFSLFARNSLHICPGNSLAAPLPLR
jgi:hypothetical protein